MSLEMDSHHFKNISGWIIAQFFITSILLFLWETFLQYVWQRLWGPLISLWEAFRNWIAPELRIVLVGRTRSGKSATGNTILGQKKFTSTTFLTSGTKTCEKYETEIDGRKIVVVDTPGLFDTNVEQEEETFEKVEKCIKQCSPGPHAIIQVMQVGRFTQKEKDINQLIQYIFSHEAKDYWIVLFTRKDNLKGKPLQTFLKEQDASLREHIDRWGGRCLAFNNRAEGEEREEQVKELLGMIDAMVEKNRKAPYCTEEMQPRDQRQIERYKRLQREMRELRKEAKENKWSCKIF